MGNADINEYVRNNTGSFRPLDGHKPSDGQQAESIFVRDTEKYFYLAVFNYSTTAAKSGKVNFKRMGIDPESIDDYLAHGGYQAITKVLTELQCSRKGRARVPHCKRYKYRNLHRRG